MDRLPGRAGRGLFMWGNHADVAGVGVPGNKARRAPLVPPVSLVNRLTLRPFNEYLAQQPQAGRWRCPL